MQNPFAQSLSDLGIVILSRAESDPPHTGDDPEALNERGRAHARMAGGLRSILKIEIGLTILDGTPVGAETAFPHRRPSENSGHMVVEVPELQPHPELRAILRDSTGLSLREARMKHRDLPDHLMTWSAPAMKRISLAIEGWKAKRSEPKADRTVLVVVERLLSNVLARGFVDSAHAGRAIRDYACEDGSAIWIRHGKLQGLISVPEAQLIEHDNSRPSFAPIARAWPEPTEEERATA